MIIISDDSSTDDENNKTMFENIMKKTLVKQESGKEHFNIDDSDDQEEEEDYVKLLREIADNGQTADSKKDTNSNFVDLTTWPKAFKNQGEALKNYNDIGLLKKIQFKKMSERRDDWGQLLSFTLWCYKRSTTKLQHNLHKGIQIKSSTKTNWPVRVLFRYNKKRKLYVRSSKLRMHHDHPLEIWDRHFMENGPIMEEIELLVKWKVPVWMIHKTINNKFQQKIRYADMYRIWKELSGQKSITEEKTEFDLFVENLEDMKSQNPNATNYHFDGKSKDGKLVEIDYVWIQTELMYYNAQNFYDLIYVDISNGTNKHDMGLVVFSGINHEKQNIIMGYGLVLEDEYKWYYNLFGTFFNKFLKDKHPLVVITDMNFEMERALSNILTPQTHHLFWQWHVKRYLKNKFIHLSVMDATPSAQLTYNLLISWIFTSDPEEFVENQQFLFYKSNDDLIKPKEYELLRDLFKIKEKWAKSHIPPDIFIASDSFNINRAESLNQLLQTRLFSDSTLTSIFKLISDTESQLNDRYAVENSYHMKKHSVSIHPLLAYVKKNYSHYCFTTVLEEYSLSHDYFISVEQGRFTVYNFSITFSHGIHMNCWRSSHSKGGNYQWGWGREEC
jgi:hypothetical protein